MTRSLARSLRLFRARALTRFGPPLSLASPPAACRGEPYNNKCDVWSLGVILFELLTLELPFHAGNMPALIMQIVNAVR